MGEDMTDDLDVRIPDKLFFRIGELSELVGVEPHVLRYWEQEFRIRPQRSPSGQRMYRRKDIARFLQIRNLLHKQGFTISGARRALADAKEGGPTAFASDTDQLRAARRKLDALRDHVHKVREDVGAVWDAYLPRDHEGSHSV